MNVDNRRWPSHHILFTLVVLWACIGSGFVGLCDNQVHAGPSCCSTIIEDFENFPNTAFVHSFDDPFPMWELSSADSKSPVTSLFLITRDSVTINIDTSQYAAIAAGVWYRAWAGGSPAPAFNVYSDSVLVSSSTLIEDGQWHFAQTGRYDWNCGCGSGNVDPAEITWIELAGEEVLFDDLSVRLIEKPQCPAVSVDSSISFRLSCFTGDPDEIIIELPDGTEVPAERCALYPSGTLISTGDATVIGCLIGRIGSTRIKYCQIVLGPVSEVVVSRFLVEEADKSVVTRVMVKSGEIRVKVTNERPSHSTDLKVSTPNSAASVVGTDFLVRSRCGQADAIASADDTVTVRWLNTGSTILVPPRNAVSDPGGGVSVLRPTGGLVWATDTIGFGAVLFGHVDTTSLLLVNSMPEPITISAIQIMGADAAYFTWLPDGPLPSVVFPGDEYLIQVGFAPDAPRNFAATLTVTSDDPLLPSLLLQLTGDDPSVQDCDGNGIWDAIDLEEYGVPDCNSNCRPDTCDIVSGTSRDINGNYVPDECECRDRGFAGDVNQNDLPWETADGVMLQSYLGTGTITGDCPGAIDADGDCIVSLLDFTSIVQIVAKGGWFFEERHHCYAFEAPITTPFPVTFAVGSSGAQTGVGASTAVPITITNPFPLTHFQVPFYVDFAGGYTVDSVTTTSAIDTNRLWTVHMPERTYLFFLDHLDPLDAGTDQVIGHMWVTLEASGTMSFTPLDDDAHPYMYTGPFYCDGVDVYDFTGVTTHDLTVVACICPYQCDLNADSFIDSIDLSVEIDIVFFGAADPQDPGCPTTRGDFNADGFTDAVDLSLVIDHVFFGGPPPTDPCAP